MSQTHTGNIQPGIDLEEHDGLLNAKRVAMASTATIYAVVNTGAAGVQNSMVTLNSGPNYIGLVTTTFGSLTTLASGNNFIGLASIRGDVDLNTGARWIGLATVTPASAWPNPNTYIGLVTVGHNLNLNSNITLNSSINNIGFATVTQAFPGSSTVFSQIISATGNTTIFVAPASNRFFIKNIHVSSLGRAELEFRSGATTLIPFTSLSTTSGWGGNYGEEGWPSRAQADGFVANLNGGATIAIGVNVRFAP